MTICTSKILKHIRPINSVIISDEQFSSLHSLLLEMLDDIWSVCDKYNIAYVLSGGTVLGAVRSEGFIPWDDDIDISIFRQDYNIFVKKFLQHYGYKYSVFTPEDSHDYQLLFVKIRRKNTVLKTRDDFGNEDCGVFIDLYIIDNTFNNAILRGIHGILVEFFSGVLSCRKFYEYRRSYLDLCGNDDNAKRVCKIKIAIGFIISFISIDTIRKIANQINSICKDFESKYVTICSGRLHFRKETFLREMYSVPTMVTFEQRNVCVPKDPEIYLTRFYGADWHIPQCQEEREQHVIFELNLDFKQKDSKFPVESST